MISHHHPPVPVVETCLNIGAGNTTPPVDQQQAQPALAVETLETMTFSNTESMTNERLHLNKINIGLGTYWAPHHDSNIQQKMVRMIERNNMAQYGC